MRKLASIQTISDILPHTNADTLEIAKVLGWTCVVLKGQFKKGDHVVFIEPDAILPEGRSEWEFMRSRGFRIKTIKLRGQVSQGLVFSAHILLADKYLPLCEHLGVTPLPDGTDVTELLGITKYEPYVPAQLAGQIKGPFPEFLHKTDEQRIQGYPQLLEKHKDKKFYVTEKVDGSSMTVYLNNGEFGVCSRNMDLKETEGNAYWKVARELDLEKKMNARSLSSIGGVLPNFALQGELIGMGVQGNKYKLSGLEFRIFNVFDINRGGCFSFEDFIIVVEQLGLKTVPLVLNEYLLPNTVDELVEFSKDKSLLNKDVHREGIVLRPLVEEYEPDLYGRLSFKVVNPEFLLKYEE
jgi:RNA ligase (TIGR02306 family)